MNELCGVREGVDRRREQDSVLRREYYLFK